MTRFRVPFSGLAIAAVGLTAVSLDAYSQVAKASGRARLIGTSNTYCDNYSSVTTYPDGAVDIQCTGGTPTPSPTPTPAGTEKGVVVFAAPTRYDVPKAPSQTLVDVPVTVTRQATVAGGVPTLGTATSNVIVMWGPCTPIGVSIPVTFQAGQQTLTLPANTIRGSALGTCGIALTGGDVNPNQKATNTSAFPTMIVGAEVTPTPSPTPSPTPTPVTPPAAGGPTIGQACTNSAGQSAPYPANAFWHGDMAARGGNQNVVDEVAGTIHVYKLPMGTLEGNIGFTSYTTLSPSSMKVEVTISKCPGDVNYYKTAAASVQYAGTTWHSCGQLGNGDSAQLGWKSTPTWYQCGVPTNEQWYMQWRVLENSCPSDHIGPCGQTFYWS